MNNKGEKNKPSGGDRKLVSTNKAIRISTGIQSEEKNTLLDAIVGFRLMKLKKKTDRMIELADKYKQKKVEQYNEVLKKGSLTDEQKEKLYKKLESDVKKIYAEKEEIMIPELKLSNFMASTNCKNIAGVEVRAGQLMVSQGFLLRLGEFIIDDMGTGNYDEIDEEEENEEQLTNDTDEKSTGTEPNTKDAGSEEV